MRNNLPLKPHRNESAIINLDDKQGPGTHWVCYRKRGLKVHYFDSYGNLQPPLELSRYFRGCEIYYNYDNEQDYNTNICGHLCLRFLYKRKL